MPAAWRSTLALLTFSGIVVAQSYTAPAGVRPALRRPGASILPGGRIIAPMGDEYAIGAGAFGLAISPSGKSIVTANVGPWRPSLTILDRQRSGRWEPRQIETRSPAALGQTGAADWGGVSIGVVFAGDRSYYVSEGNSGRIAQFDSSDERRRAIDLNQNGYTNSYSGDLAFDAGRGILYAADQANFRVAAIDVRTRQILASVRVGRLPFMMALSPDGRKLYVTNVGMFEYRAIPGADPSQARATGLTFPAFGFPGADAVSGAERRTAQGAVKVPGLGDPNAPESNSVCMVDVSTPAAPKVEAFVRTGLPFGAPTGSGNSRSGSSPSGVIATGDRVFVSNANNDSITIIDAKTHSVTDEIPIRIPGLEKLRGVGPAGLAYDEKSGWLLVAEAGINAVGVIDIGHKRVLGHLPAAWFPTRVAVDGGLVFVANAKGHGVGPDASGEPPSMLGLSRAAAAPFGPSSFRDLYQGSLSVFPLPAERDLAKNTELVMQANGFAPRTHAEAPLPDGIRHVVLIVKESRSFDEVLGDITKASDGPVMGSPALARFGSKGSANGGRQRLSIKQTNLTPNEHVIARQWAFSDNFYADAEGSVDGHHWLTGAYPNAWTESSLLAAYGNLKDFRMGSAPGRMSFAGTAASVQPEDYPEGGTIWQHMAAHGVSFVNFGEGFELGGIVELRGPDVTGSRFMTNMPMPVDLFFNTSREYPGFNMTVPDQYRASQVIHEIDERFVTTGKDLPQFLFIHLPGDFAAQPKPAEGYPYEESYIVDNDLALARIVEYLSGTKWWKEMAIFVTEDDAEGGVDHIDSHRTLLNIAGPWAKHDYVSHINSGFPSLWKTIFRLLRLPPLNLFDVSASDLSDCFSTSVNPAGFKAVNVDKRIFDDSAVTRKEPAKPGDAQGRERGNIR